MIASLASNPRPSGATLLQLAVLGINLALVGAIVGVGVGLFRPGAVEDPIPPVDPLRIALDPEPAASEFGDLVALVGAQLDVPLPEAPPAEATPAPPAAPSPLAGWSVVALLQRPGIPATAILGGGGRQVTVQVGDAFLGGEVCAIELDPESGRIHIQVRQGEQLADLEQRFSVE